MKGFFKIMAFDLDGNKIGEYDSVTQASRDKGIHRSNIDDCLRGSIFQTKGIVWEKWVVDKSIFAYKKTFTINEYMYIHGISYVELERRTGINKTYLCSIANGANCSEFVRKKLLDLDIDLMSGIDPKDYIFIPPGDIYEFGYEEIQDYVCRFTRKKKFGKFRCSDIGEAHITSFALTNINIPNYIRCKSKDLYIVRYGR